ncbi:MAG: hypothetical protein D6780_02870, partial [Candidatus Dadabacteria bacterium]
MELEGKIKEFLPEEISLTIIKNFEEKIKKKPFQSGRGITVYTFSHPRGWGFAVATLALPFSEELSLGGFRILPKERIKSEELFLEKEAALLAVGMQEKIEWSKKANIAGPLGQSVLSKLYGGKCVLYPFAGSRVGEPLDFDMLKFACTCLNALSKGTGIFPVTGQDLGHGTMSDGKTSSLNFLHRNYSGAVTADTSVPTAAGNFYVVKGALKAFQIELYDAAVGLIGWGNIGSNLGNFLLKEKASFVVMEAREEKRKRVKERGIKVFSTEEWEKFFTLPLVAFIFNAQGNSITKDVAELLCQNAKVKLVTGCENLLLGDPSFSAYFTKAKKLFIPTEYTGMMGYLTAVE